jgi:3-phenylpropionate/cinnamic acid dioxygenase small subunit
MNGAANAITMTDAPGFEDAQRVIQREALLVDRGDWDAWLALYMEDCRFWVPSWRDERTLVQDPQTEISFLFAESRRTLEERVRRITGGKSITTHPMPRTVHLVTSGVELQPSVPGRICIASAWSCWLYDPRTHQTRQSFGHYEHELVRPGADEVRIASKKVILANDRIATVLDLYSI